MIQKNLDPGALNYFYSINLHLIYIKEARTNSVHVDRDTGTHFICHFNMLFGTMISQP